ncbi:MAG: hypothetical protein EOO43_16460 [Flavobacterium sp.]|nr:MAG: hypothetical protein EOO43_16460 [Flavobacterium sp.]
MVLSIATTAAAGKAFQEMYNELKKEELSNIISPLKKVYTVASLALEIENEIEAWQEKNRNDNEIINKVNEIMKLTRDGINRNQTIIDLSVAKSKSLLDKSIKHLNSRKLL